MNKAKHGGSRREWLDPVKKQRRLLAAGGLLLLEYLVVSHLVDASTVKQRGGIWELAGNLGDVGPVIVTVAATWYLLFRLGPTAAPTKNVEHKEEQDLATHTDGAEAGWRFKRVSWLLTHLVLAVVFLWVTELLFTRDDAPRGPALLWLLLWVALGIASAATLLAGVLGGTRWLSVLPKGGSVAGPLGLLAWLAGSRSAELWNAMSAWTLLATEFLLEALGQRATVFLESHRLLTGHMLLEVSPGCGGHEAFGVSLVLLVGYLLYFRNQLRFPLALVLLPIGLLAVWVANLLRFVVLSLVGASFGVQATVASFHSKASWVLFCAVTLFVVAVARNWVLRTLPKKE